MFCWLRCAWSGWWRKSFGFPLIFHDYYNQILLTDHAISWTTYVLLYYWANTFLWFFANLLAVLFLSSFLCSAGWWDVHYLGDEENRRVTPSPKVHLHIFTALDWLYMHSFIGYEPYCSLCSVGLNCMIPGDEENRSDSHWYFMISVTSYFWWMKPCISFRWIVALLLLHFIWYRHEIELHLMQRHYGPWN